MKTCNRCREEKPLDEFRNRKASKDGKEAACKNCRQGYDNATYASSPDRKTNIAASNQKRRVERFKFIIDYLKSHPCVDCGQTDWQLLDFDHTNAENKVDSIANMVSKVVPMTRLVAEIEKCVSRCLYCHRKRTIEQFGWYAWLED
jgi:hypothetical protein